MYVIFSMLMLMYVLLTVVKCIINTVVLLLLISDANVIDTLFNIKNELKISKSKPAKMTRKML